MKDFDESEVIDVISKACKIDPGDMLADCEKNKQGYVIHVLVFVDDDDAARRIESFANYCISNKQTN